MSWIWHGFNLDPMRRRKQCFYRWNCLFCYIRLLVRMIALRIEYR